MKGKLFELLMMSAILGGGDGRQRIEAKDISGKLPPKPVPAGCKEYFFNEHGRFCNGDGKNKILRSEVVFECVASNDKNAIKKFEKWKQKA